LGNRTASTMSACRLTASDTGTREARNVRLPRFHALVCEDQDRTILGQTHHDSEAKRTKLREVKEQLKRRQHEPVPE
jgi:hypothetical protein